MAIRADFCPTSWSSQTCLGTLYGIPIDGCNCYAVPKVNPRGSWMQRSHSRGKFNNNPCFENAFHVGLHNFASLFSIPPPLPRPNPSALALRPPAITPNAGNMGDVPGTKVWVGNLGSTCEERDLRDEFSKFGELNKVWLP